MEFCVSKISSIHGTHIYSLVKSGTGEFWEFQRSPGGTLCEGVFPVPTASIAPTSDSASCTFFSAVLREPSSCPTAEPTTSGAAVLVVQARKFSIKVVVGASILLGML